MASKRKACDCPQPNTFANLSSGQIVKGACFAWSCPSCGPKRRTELSYRMRHAVVALMKETGQSAQFLTLTLDPERNRESGADGTKAQARYAAGCFRKFMGMLRERCRRRERPPLFYVKVADWRAQTSALHYHVIIIGWMPGKIENDVVSAGFGRVFDVQKVKDPKRICRYLTKYVTKNATQEAPRYVNRYSASRKTLPPIPMWIRVRRLVPGFTTRDSAMQNRWWIDFMFQDHLDELEERAEAAEDARRSGNAPPVRFIFVRAHRDRCRAG